MKKIILVGGGISSCILAIFLKDKNHKVEIYEKTNSLGGVLKDYNFNDNIFFKGIQYFDIKNQWHEKFIKLFKKEFNIFEHIYGSFSEIDNKKYSTFNFAAPYFKKINLKNLPTLQKLKKNKRISLEDRLSFYGSKEKSFLLNIVKRHKLDAKKISFNSAIALQMDRIAYLESTEEIIDLKKKFILDDFYAIERFRIFNEKLIATLPKKGFSNFFTYFEKILKQKGIKIFLKQKIEPVWKGNKLSLFSNDKLILNDHVIWSGDPSKLIQSYNGQELDSMFTRFIQVHSNVSSNFDKNIYFQIFSEKSNITRIYLYEINNQKKISLECIVHPVDEKKILDEAVKILEKFKIKIKTNKNTIHQKIDTRFNILSVKDEEIIKIFLDKTKKSNLLNGAWLYYGRDNKISHFLQVLKKKKLI